MPEKWLCKIELRIRQLERERRELQRRISEIDNQLMWLKVDVRRENRIAEK